jgi:hypothetical protein
MPVVSCKGKTRTSPRVTRASSITRSLRIRKDPAELAALRAAEATRPLAADEARRVTRLRLKSEALRLELAGLHAEFEGLRRDTLGQH